MESQGERRLCPLFPRSDLQTFKFTASAWSGENKIFTERRKGEAALVCIRFAYSIILERGKYVAPLTRSFLLHKCDSPRGLVIRKCANSRLTNRRSIASQGEKA